jgi:hypothetical protein
MALMSKRQPLKKVNRGYPRHTLPGSEPAGYLAGSSQVKLTMVSTSKRRPPKKVNRGYPRRTLPGSVTAQHLAGSSRVKLTNMTDYHAVTTPPVNARPDDRKAQPMYKSVTWLLGVSRRKHLEKGFVAYSFKTP